MRKKLAVYIPNYNGEAFLREVFIPSECDCVVMDNCSTDNSRKICRDRSFLFVENINFVSRTENWLRCIEHFRKSEYQWMKWLFVGDELANDAYETMFTAMTEYKEAAEVIFNYQIVSKNKTAMKSLEVEKSGYWTYNEVLAEMAQHANIFGAPIAVMISKNANFDAVKPKGFFWAEDEWFALQLARDRKIAYVDKRIGKFNINQRKMYSSMRTSYKATMEEIAVQQEVVLEAKRVGELLKESDKKVFLDKILICLENNSYGVRGLWTLQKMVFRCLIKNILIAVGWRKMK